MAKTGKTVICAAQVIEIMMRARASIRIMSVRIASFAGSTQRGAAALCVVGAQYWRLSRTPMVRGRPGWAMSALVKKLRVRSYS